VLRLLNEPSFLRFIGDRGVRTLDDARRYITDRFIASYEKNGFGLWIVERKSAPGAIGISGLVKRDTLPEPDIGFAFLPEFWGQGYAFEAAAAVKEHAFGRLEFARLLAITNDDNASSIRVVEKLGLGFVRMIALTTDADEVRLFALDAAAS
jgi:RimJ/RimL family protein N-acetyltransferase